MNKKKFCINIDSIISEPSAIAVFLNECLLLVFIFLIILFRNDLPNFFNTLISGGYIWIFLSGPIVLFISICVSLIFLISPISFMEMNNNNLKIHRFNKKDIIIEYDKIIYIRLNLKRKKEYRLLLLYVIFFWQTPKVNTIEIFTYENGYIYLSSSYKAYRSLVSYFTYGLLSQNYIQGEGFIAEKTWYKNNGSPHNIYDNIMS